MLRTPGATRHGAPYVHSLSHRPGFYQTDPYLYKPKKQYTLPKMRRAMSKPSRSSKPDAATTTSSPAQQTTNPGDEPGVAVTVRSLRNPPLDVRLAPQPRSASLLDIKALVTAESGIPAQRLKLLHRRKPVADSKILADLLLASGGADPEKADGGHGGGAPLVELSVMVMGGSATTPAAPAVATEETPGGGSGSGSASADVLDGDAFWLDLRGFLLQRVRDEKLAAELADVFQTAWRARR